MSKTETSKKPSHKAYIVREYGEGKSHWTIVGALWKHGDGEGFNLEITDGLALSGKVVIRPAKEKQTAE